MKTLSLFAGLLLSVSLLAQNTAGTIQFEEVVTFAIELPPEMQAMADQIPTEQKTSTELLFSATESLYRANEAAKAPATNKMESEGMEVEVNAVVIGGGSSSVTWQDLKSGTGLRAEDLMGKEFLVTLGKREAKWKVLGEQRTILGYTCMKATANIDDRVATAWFTTQIPLPIGPDAFGGLPGAILAIKLPRERGKTTIAATKVTLGTPAAIEKPSTGKKVTQEEFNAIVERKMQEMQEMYGGEDHGNGENVIRIEVTTD